MCTTGYIYYRACGHLAGPTHFPCRALGRCAGARPNGVELASRRFLEVCAPCYACHFVRGPDGAYRYVDLIFATNPPNPIYRPSDPNSLYMTNHSLCLSQPFYELRMQERRVMCVCVCVCDTPVVRTCTQWGWARFGVYQEAP
ncbi:hypothetical protein F4775DRAFT_574489 [Biscogniauxia sp. FL1348]|nr:hypothetical protein F4775DRAFT_574489 [Biscogniauxia sp. FL1348]